MKRTVLFTCLILILLVLSACASTAATPTTAANTDAVTTGTPVALLNVTLEAPITTTLPETTARPSVLDIPNATEFDEDDERFQRHTIRICGGGLSREAQEQRTKAWLENQVKEEHAVVMGQVTDYTSALVPDGDGYYVITTMEIKVIQDISGVGKDTVTAVYACRYKPYATYYIPEATYYMKNVIASDGTVIDAGYTTDMFDDYLTHTSLYSDDRSVGIFLLNNAEGKEVRIENNSYKLSDYSDSVMDACLLYRIGSGIAQLTGSGMSVTNVFFHLFEEVFGLNEPKPNPEQPKPTYDEGAIDILRGKESPTYEPDTWLMAIKKIKDGAFFMMEDAYADFAGHPALVLSLNTESVIYENLFIKTQDPSYREANTDYAWALVIDGTVYDINQYSLVMNGDATLLYLDLGKGFDVNQNVNEIILGLYDKYDTPYSFDFFANLTDDALYGGYTHTKPN